jgi:hypothetical protein
MPKDRKRGDDDEWKAEWKDMPEFIQEDLTSFRKIIVHFQSQEDVDAFAKLVGQNIGPKQPSIGFPQRVVRRYANKRYVDGDES